MSASHDSARHHALNEIQNHHSRGPRRGRHARPSQHGVNRLLGVHHGSTGRRLKTGLTTLAATGAFLGATAVAAPSADAGALTIGQKALRIAESKHGDPYRWGATGPNSFDCSGLTYYAFRHAGRHLPRTAQDQYNRVQHISFRQLRPGDLIFFHYGSYVYHVGIYAGHWEIWHAPHSGSYVKLEHIWTDSVWFGRVN
ncbi:C40 family peptidase [Streptacidiphilus jiangxiensis]|uniref:NlpC/P60 family protein n=1 Tax=Streptacidiphilus jiangxiensis TaxID=235985 RepID=A0A1H7U6R3_STRJI|nr:NlpC/P60 family protein [Streptacidiphilus jiangxiensis]SEL91987.1 NlpC/P60 family protein [Streptacidiphilus jiangxiensis]